MIWLSNRLQVAGTLVVSNAAVAAISSKERGLARLDLVSIQGEFSKGDVLHVYDEEGNEFARGLTNFSSEETILMARNPDMLVEDVIGYKTKSDIIGSENILILEDHHLQLDAPEDDNQRVVSV
jgi:glutamate 5-kinase